VQLENELIQKQKVGKILHNSIIIFLFSDIYHITWNIPASRDVQERLVQLEENSEKVMHQRLKEYRR